MGPRMALSRVLFIGRFQPFHKGHLAVIEWLLERFDEVVVVVGMASESHTWRNPFTAGERLLMIREALREKGLELSRIITVTAPTLEVNIASLHYILMLSPPVHAIATRNPVMEAVARDIGLNVISPPLFHREAFMGEKIRLMIVAGDEKWKELVPPSVVKIIEDVNGVERLKKLYKVCEVGGAGELCRVYQC